MRDDKTCFCSDLVLVSSQDLSEVANLELIGPTGCSITMDAALPTGTLIEMQCMSCPQGEDQCSKCRFKGRVAAREADPRLGNSIQVNFEGRRWSRKEWLPRHLTQLDGAEPAARK
jgi:hypothetical protein